jgi:D-amino-acid oxidase
VLVEAEGVGEWLLDQSDPEHLLYVVPRERDVVLGGTAQEGDEDLRADPATAEAILSRCAAAVPALRGARVTGGRVGLRPVRPAVRLESEDRTGGRIVHCYGHGGAGVTLAWGCAEEVVALAGAG